LTPGKGFWYTQAFATSFQGVFRYSGFATLAAGGVFSASLTLTSIRKSIRMDPIHDKAPIDVGELMEMMGDDRELIRVCLADFTSEYDELIGAIREAAGRGDGEALEQAAHALKGSLTYLAATPAAEAAFELEKSGRDRDLLNLEAKLGLLERECGKLGAFIKGFTV